MAQPDGQDGMTIIVGALLLTWFGSILIAYDIGARRTAGWIFHAIAWGRYRDSGDGIVNDHGNCLDHDGCKYDYSTKHERGTR